MREVVLILIVASIVIISLFKPKVGLLGYLWFALLRPDYLAWTAGEYPFSFVLAVCTLLSAVPRYFVRFGALLASGVSMLLLLQSAVMGVSVVAANSLVDAWEPYSLYLRVIVMALLIPVMTETLTDMKYLMLTLAFSMGFLGFRFGFYGLIRGGARFDAGYGGFLADNNCVALAFVMVVPLCFYAYRNFATGRWVRWGFLVMMFGSCAGVVWTHSRGGALALGCVLLILVMRSKKRLLALAGMSLLALPAIWMVRESYLERLATISEYEAEASAQSRIELAQAALKVWSDHPVFGVGFGSVNFQKVIGSYLGREDNHVAHNTYLQVAADSGTPALIIYAGLLFATILWLRGSVTRMHAAGRADLAAYPEALQTGLIGFAVGSTFLSRVTFDFYYILLTTAAAWFLLERQISISQSDGSPVMSHSGAVQPVPSV